MTDDNFLLPRPTEHELELARQAAQRRSHLCGCYGQLLRDPFLPALVSHWRTYHAQELAILAQSQANRAGSEGCP